MVCAVCGGPMVDGARFCSSCGCAVGQAAYPREQRRMTRPRGGRVIAGVLCLAVFFGVGTPILAYAVAWIVMPESPLVVPVYGAEPVAAAPMASSQTQQPL
jgi:phage shock protein PspC (stress-responsive transcriptional regulator)